MPIRHIQPVVRPNSRFRMPAINWLGILGMMPPLLIAFVFGGHAKSAAKSPAAP